MRFKVSLPLCWNDANPLVFTEMCQTEQSLSQSSLCLSSIFISLPFSLACNQPLCMAENNIAPLKRDHTWEKQPTPAALSCRIQKIKITKNRPASNAPLWNLYRSRSSSCSPLFLLSQSPWTFFTIHLDAKNTAREGKKKHSNSQHVHTNTCVLSEKKKKKVNINTHASAASLTYAWT